MILIKDPAYNEPNVEQMRGTAEGEQRSTTYNFEVRTGLVRRSSPKRPDLDLNAYVADQLSTVHRAEVQTLVLPRLEQRLSENIIDLDGF